jgi:selenide,water dikinase
MQWRGCDDLIVGIEGNEDATVYRLDASQALVQTVDLITPVVDDPYVYGQVAAANSLSDLFAMGGRVITAMNIVGFDACHHSAEVLAEILAGGASKVAECGGVIAGGHTIETPEMLYGMSVSGLVHPDRIWRNNTPRIGDLLVLTKPLGMGVLTTGIKADMVDPEHIPVIADILTQLNHRASVVMQEYAIHACTDVTGFGLSGHAYEMAGDRVSIRIEYSTLPILEWAVPLGQMGIIPAGTHNNEAFLREQIEIDASIEDPLFLFDAQTSGGLLIALSAAEAPRLVRTLRNEGYAYAAVVGEVVSRTDAPIVVAP